MIRIGHVTFEDHRFVAVEATNVERDPSKPGASLYLDGLICPSKDVVDSCFTFNGLSANQIVETITAHRERFSSRRGAARRVLDAPLDQTKTSGDTDCDGDGPDPDPSGEETSGEAALGKTVDVVA